MDHREILGDEGDSSWDERQEERVMRINSRKWVGSWKRISREREMFDSSDYLYHNRYCHKLKACDSGLQVIPQSVINWKIWSNSITMSKRMTYSFLTYRNQSFALSQMPIPSCEKLSQNLWGRTMWAGPQINNSSSQKNYNKSEFQSSLYLKLTFENSQIYYQRSHHWNNQII